MSPERPTSAPGAPFHDWSMSDDELVAAILKAGSLRAYALERGMGRSTVTFRLQQRGLKARVANALMAQAQPVAETKPIVTLSNENERSLHGVKEEDLADSDELMRSRGFDPEKWTVVAASLTEWGMNPETGLPLKRLRIDIKRSLSILSLLPAAQDPPKRPVPVRKASKEPRTWVILSDQHAPYHDKALHECVLAFLRDTQPDHGILAGDTLDFPYPSRHRRNPKFNASPQECVDTAYRMLRDYVEASPGTTWTKLIGNHDQRLRNFLLEGTGHELATLRPADTGAEDVTPALAVSRLLHLDSLGIHCLEPEGEYSHEMAEVCRHLGVIHGDSTAKNSGEVELRRYGHSIVKGHVHRKGSTWMTAWDWDGASTRVAVDLGCMCEIDDGLGYAVKPNWQQGFALVSVHPDDKFNAEHVTFTGGSLFFRDQRWTPKQAAA